MWGSWFGVTVAGLLAFLLLVAIAFGTSALLVPVLIVIAIGLGVAALAIMRRFAGAQRPPGSADSPNPAAGGRPAHGEGSPPPPHSP